jgi:hypothetical protein
LAVSVFLGFLSIEIRVHPLNGSPAMPGIVSKKALRVLLVLETDEAQRRCGRLPSGSSGAASLATITARTERVAEHKRICTARLVDTSLDAAAA